MINTEILTALDLPATSLVQQRIPKTMLVKNGAPTPGDKRKINEGIEELQWLAALKPTTIGVPEYRDPTREYLEIAVISVEYREGARANRLNELIHRAIPYPILLSSKQDATITLSMAHKRWSQNQTGAVVLEGEVFLATIDDTINETIREKFLKALSLNSQPQNNLLNLYQGWIDTLIALLAAKKTGLFVLKSSREQTIARHEALKECYRLEAMIFQLRSIAIKERQIPKLANINLELKELEVQLKQQQELL